MKEYVAFRAVNTVLLYCLKKSASNRKWQCLFQMHMQTSGIKQDKIRHWNFALSFIKIIIVTELKNNVLNPV